jgi:hypothetical protein
MQTSTVLYLRFFFSFNFCFRSVFCSAYYCCHPLSMADDQDAQNEGAEGEDVDGAELPDDYDAAATTTVPAAETRTSIESAVNPENAVNPESVVNPVNEDDSDESAEEYVVKLYVNAEPPGVSLSPDLVNAGLTDMYGNVIPPTTTSLIDSVNDYTASITQGIYDELNGNDTTVIPGGKGWWGKFVN